MDRVGNGTGVFTLDVTVIVDGVHTLFGDGGKTNSVCDGVLGKVCGRLGAVDGGAVFVPRRWRGGGAGLRDSLRVRGSGWLDGGSAVGVGADGDGGTVGRPGGTDRRFHCISALDKSCGFARNGRIGGFEREKDDLCAGAEGGSRESRFGCERCGRRLMSMVLLISAGELLELEDGSSVVFPPEFVPKSSCSSSSSMRSSLNTLPLLVRLLAEEPARFR